MFLQLTAERPRWMAVRFRSRLCVFLVVRIFGETVVAVSSLSPVFYFPMGLHAFVLLRPVGLIPGRTRSM